MTAISTITFETAAFADVIKKAEKVAPKKGAAFDKAAGILIQFDPAGVPLAVVKATNLNLFSMEWVNVADMSGEPATWRLPSFLLAHVVSSLPIDSGKTVTMYSEASGHNTIIHLKSGRTKVRFHPIDHVYYPPWGAFDPDHMFPANDLGGRISQVEWAASGSDATLSGVYLDGEYAIATDKFRLARVPLLIPELEEPIVIPSGVLGSILRPTGETQIGSSGQMLHIMPDEHTQIKSVIMDVKYPNVSKITSREFDNSILLSRDALIAAINRVLPFGAGDRVAPLKMFFGRGEIAVFMQNEEVGQIGDVVEVPGYADHDRFESHFTPKNLMDALNKSPNDKISLMYNVGQGKGLFKVDDNAGYEAWVMPRAGDRDA